MKFLLTKYFEKKEEKYSYLDLELMILFTNKKPCFQENVHHSF
jgi:hypothetical protein